MVREMASPRRWEIRVSPRGDLTCRATGWRQPDDYTNAWQVLARVNRPFTQGRKQYAYGRLIRLYGL